MTIADLRARLRGFKTISATLVLLTLLAACGAEPAVISADAESGIATTDTSCDEQQSALLDQFKGDLSDDYQPAASPNQLANDYSDYVVRADSVVRMSLDEGRVTMTLADLTVLPVHETDLTEPLTIEWWITSTDAALLDGLAYDRVSVVAFIEEFNGVYRPLVEGLYVGCGDDGPAAALIADPIEAGWPTGPDLTLAALVTVVVDPAALDPIPQGEQADGTFVNGPLTCYEDLFEDSIGDFAEDAVGADTPDEAVDRWWTQGDGRFRDDREELTESMSGTQVLYDDERGNTQLALGLRELPAGGWAVETTMACAYL